MVGKIVLAAGAAVAAIVMSGGSAFAFHCFNASRSDQGNAGAAHGQALVSLEELLADPEFVGLCPDGVEHVINGLEEAGFDSGIVINFRTVMAQGLEKNGKGGEKLSDGQGIDFLDPELEAAADALIGEGFGICED